MNPRKLFKTLMSTVLVATLALSALPVTAFAASKPKYSPVKVDYRADYFYLKNKNSGKYLDVSGGKAGNGKNIIQWSYTGKKNQQFTFYKLSNGNYSIDTVIDNTKANYSLDVARRSTKAGANVQLWKWDSSAPENQQWSFKRQKDGSYKIYNITGGKYLSVAGGSKKNGANVVQGTAGDVWIIETSQAEKPKEYNPYEHYPNSRKVEDIDIDALIAYGIKYGESIGMEYDPSTNKKEGTSWGAAITIGRRYANSVTEQSIRNRMDRLKKVDKATVFGFWYETGAIWTSNGGVSKTIDLYITYGGGSGGNNDLIVSYD